MSLLAIISTACMVPMLIFMFGSRDMSLGVKEKGKQETEES